MDENDKYDSILESLKEHEEAEEARQVLSALGTIFVFGVAVGLLTYYLAQHLTIGWR